MHLIAAQYAAIKWVHPRDCYPSRRAGRSRPTVTGGGERQPEIRNYDTAAMRFRALAAQWLYCSVRFRFDAYARLIGRAGSGASLALTSCRAAPESGRCERVTRP